MFFYSLSFLAGVMYLLFFSDLPSVWSISLTACGVCLLYFINRYLFILGIIFFLGFTWHGLYAYSMLIWSLEKSYEDKPVLIEGYIDSMPVSNEFQTHFNFLTKKINFGHESSAAVSTKFVLTWQKPTQKLRVGDYWQFYVKLKRIHTPQNEGTFDYESWAIQKGLRAKGTIIKGNNKYLGNQSFRYPIQSLRQIIDVKLEKHLPNSRLSHWLRALILGDKNNISATEWAVLRNTGTNHLMAIAGLHIGLMSGFIHLIVSFFWRRISFLSLLLPAQQAGLIAALCMTYSYSALAGFSLPTSRACIMLSVVILASLFMRKINAWHGWATALIIVLIVNPINVLSESFWLSFGTIALIIYGLSSRLAPNGYWWKWGRAQWVIGVGLIPITINLFQELSLVSFAANTVAIPWLGFLILPFCLFSIPFLFVIPSFADFLLWIADRSLNYLWLFLQWMGSFHMASLHLAMPNTSIFLFTVIGFILLLSPVGFPGKYLGLIWLLPLLFYKPATPERGDVWMTLLDVGQGLSVIIQTKHHTLIYDAGPKWNDHDAGANIILPYLYQKFIHKIDALVISHGDNDHIGGAKALQQYFSIPIQLTSVPEKLGDAAQLCLAEKQWVWDEVNFILLHPTISLLHKGNDSSCVLKITTGKKSVLLTGDIEKKAEKNLVAMAYNLLKADILVAPHHGSKTSAEKNFVQAVSPKYVLYAIGYKNRYHFPHAKVIEAYKNMNAISLDTASTGEIIFHIQKNNIELLPLYRKRTKRYFRDG